MQTLVLLELTLAKLHLWSVVSSRQLYLKKFGNISASNIRRRNKVSFLWTLNSKNKILKGQFCSVYNSLRKSGKLGDSVFQTSKVKVRKFLSICFFRSSWLNYFLRLHAGDVRLLWVGNRIHYIIVSFEIKNANPEVQQGFC